ncbi:MAG: ABC-2 family transporter protein [Candidatus Woesebacteria bacterium]|nr:ABC-2 family transporter protein [Candidatus Woesebacteria bacterium]
MKKYLQIFKLSFQQEFAYRLNFVMWRVRNILQIILTFFLWSSVFKNPETSVFGYNQEKILTYVFGILILRAIVFSARAVDVAGEISNGDITNFLLKPISYFKYWATRDTASKVLNLSFSVVEITILFVILRPHLFLQTNLLILFAVFVFLILAVILFFCLLFITNMSAFWMPENGWAAQFLFIAIITDFLSGGVFPLDILPYTFQKVLYSTPFPYLLFFPLQVYLGKIAGLEIIRGLVTSFAWVFILFMSVRFIWAKGLKRYSAEGR